MAINIIQQYTNNNVLDPTLNITSAAPLKILVVEDNPLNQKVAQLFLEGLGYKVDIAANGQQALALFHHDYALILMDVGLPDINGLELTGRIRSLEQGSGRHITIIAATANGESYHQRCLDAGMDDFMTKPLLFDKLQQVLAKYQRSMHTNAH